LSCCAVQNNPKAPVEVLNDGSRPHVPIDLIG